METLVDDIGSYPLPVTVKEATFSHAYQLDREAMANGKDIRKDAFLWENFGNVTLDALKQKCLTGLDVVACEPFEQSMG